ncbi:MAG: hypothetical protein QOE97_2459 [Pseudonocardiales bacterium]|nr:hypothetical protein [Pseudonocardiales bacterium]
MVTEPEPEQARPRDGGPVRPQTAADERDDGPALPQTSADERDVGWGDDPAAGERDEEWYLRERPPHHGD